MGARDGSGGSGRHGVRHRSVPRRSVPRRSVLRCLALGALAPAAAACGEEGAPESLGFADIGDRAPAAWLLGLWQVEDAHGDRRLLYVLPQGTWRIQADGTETDSGRWRLQDGRLTWTVDGGRPGAAEGVPDTVGAALSKDYRLSGGPAGGYGSVRVRYDKGPCAAGLFAGRWRALPRPYRQPHLARRRYEVRQRL